METEIATALIEMGATLSTMLLNGIGTKIDSKIKSLKAEKDADKIRNEYEEIINQLLSERAEALRIAQAYQEELKRYQISDEDIEHLHATVERLLEIIKNMSPDTPVDTFKQFKELISVDTLKAMQLLGFNYKAAIGEPLTKKCAEAIANIGNKPHQNKHNITNNSRK